MPRVEYPKSRRRPAILALATAVVVLITVISSSFLAPPGAALAVGSSLPDPADDSDPNISLVIAQNSNGLVLNAPVTWAKFYFDASETTGQVQIWNSPYDPCGGTVADPDWSGPRAGNAGCISDAINSQVRYDFYGVANNQEALGPLLFTLDGQTGLDANTGARRATIARNNWTTNIALPLNGIVSATSGFKVVYVKAYFAGGLGANFTKLHSFKLRTGLASDQTGYWAQAGTSSGNVKPAVGQYAVHYIGPKNDFRVQDVGFKFAPPCTLLAPGETASIRWFDADAGANSPMNFDLYKIVPGNPNPIRIVHVDRNSIPNLGGNNIFREFDFQARPGEKYQWIWHQVHGAVMPSNTANNLQFWLPYDSINYNSNCFDYHSTIDPADGKTPGQTLDFANPADRHVQFWVNANNLLGSPGPVATTKPTVSPVGSTTQDFSVGNGNVNRVIGGGAVLNHVVQFAYQFDALTPDGIYCFGDTIRPHTDPADAGIASDNSICYTVKNDRRFPSVIGRNSDIHAGGGLCGTQNAGPIKGVPAAGSFGQYVVSAAPLGAAGGTIQDFGSNNNAASTALNLGKDGGYSQVCRRDIFAYAESGKDLTKPTMHPITTPGTYVLDGMSGVYYASVPIAISGKVNSKVTIVMENGDLVVSGNAQINPAGSWGNPRSVAALGIIAGPNSDVAINPTATRVDAFIFGERGVYTCAVETAGGPANAPSGCGNTLTLDGFIMAKTISLERLGPDNTTGSQTGEQLQMIPQLYLDPPFFFDSGIDSTSLQGLGEKQPLF